MKNEFHRITTSIPEENLYVASEVICDDTGVHYICSVCGKYHDSDLEALLCCPLD